MWCEHPVARPMSKSKKRNCAAKTISGPRGPFAELHGLIAYNRSNGGSDLIAARLSLEISNRFYGAKTTATVDFELKKTLSRNINIMYVKNYYLSV